MFDLEPDTRGVPVVTLMLYHIDYKCASVCIGSGNNTGAWSEDMTQEQHNERLRRAGMRRGRGRSPSPPPRSTGTTSGRIELRAWRPRSHASPAPVAGARVSQAREERDVVQVKIAAAIEVNQATIALEDGTAWPRHPEEVLMAYATELEYGRAACGCTRLCCGSSTSRSSTRRARSRFGPR